MTTMKLSDAQIKVLKMIQECPYPYPTNNYNIPAGATLQTVHSLVKHGFAIWEGDDKHIAITSQGVEWLAENGMIERKQETPAPVETIAEPEAPEAPVAPALSEEETIALMLVADAPVLRDDLRGMTSDAPTPIDIILYTIGLIDMPLEYGLMQGGSYYVINDTGRAYLRQMGA